MRHCALNLIGCAADRNLALAVQLLNIEKIGMECVQTILTWMVTHGNIHPFYVRFKSSPLDTTAICVQQKQTCLLGG